MEELEENEHPPVSPYYELFNYMAEQYGLVLLESELQEITTICKQLLDSEFDR